MYVHNIVEICISECNFHGKNLFWNTDIWKHEKYYT